MSGMFSVVCSSPFLFSGGAHSTSVRARLTGAYRMQIGYWSVPITSADTNFTTSVDPYIPGAWPYLLRALGWAKKHGLHVILDLHGAPGSQNGYDNSGQRGSANWAQGNNVARTVDILRFIADQIGGMIDVLELLNEPGGWQEDIARVVSDFYENAYNAVREAAGPSLKIMISDAFLGVGVCQGNQYLREYKADYMGRAGTVS